MAAFRQGLAETGFTEGNSVAIVSLEADNKPAQLPALAAELVRRQVNVIVCPQSSVAALAARDATTRLPIVFSTTVDPVRLGLVASLARPGGNVTGINNFSTRIVGQTAWSSS